MMQINETDNFIQLCDYSFQTNSPKTIKEAINGINCYIIEGIIGSHETEATNNITYTNLDELLKKWTIFWIKILMDITE